MRLTLAAAGALLLPFPGPHISGWLPMAAVILGEDARSAPPLFFVFAGAILVVYTGMLFAGISLLQYAVRLRRRRSPIR